MFDQAAMSSMTSGMFFMHHHAPAMVIAHLCVPSKVCLRHSSLMCCDDATRPGWARPGHAVLRCAVLYYVVQQLWSKVCWSVLMPVCRVAIWDHSRSLVPFWQRLLLVLRQRNNTMLLCVCNAVLAYLLICNLMLLHGTVAMSPHHCCIANSCVTTSSTCVSSACVSQSWG